MDASVLFRIGRIVWSGGDAGVTLPRELERNVRIVSMPSSRLHDPVSPCKHCFSMMWKEHLKRFVRVRGNRLRI